MTRLLQILHPVYKFIETKNPQYVAYTTSLR